MIVPEMALIEGPQPSPDRAEVRPSSRSMLSIGQGFLLAAAFGVALGIGTVGGHVLGMALAVPLTLAVSIVVALPSLFVVLAMLGAPIELGRLVAAAVRAYRYATLTLGGLEPTLLLLSTSIDDPMLVYRFGVAGLLLAGALGAYRLISEALPSLSKDVGSAKARQSCTLLGFVWLGFELGARFWTFALSLLGGVS